jgi:hypothetical protein
MYVERDRAALPGQIGGILGTLLLWAWMGWPFAVTFLVGAIVGSTRLQIGRSNEQRR